MSSERIHTHKTKAKHVYARWENQETEEKYEQVMHYIIQWSQPTADLVVTVTPTSTDNSHVTQRGVAMVIPVVIDPLVKQVQCTVNCHHWKKKTKKYNLTSDGYNVIKAK